MRYLVEGLLPGVLQLAIGAIVFLIRPGRPQSWLFLSFLLIASIVSITFADAHTTYRFSELFLTAWAFWPATLLHLALTFPQRRGIVRRFPRVVWLPYLVSAVVAVLLLQLPLVRGDVRRLLAVPAVGAAYWGVALILLVLSLARASMVGGTPLIRQRARILCAAFVLGYVPPILGTVAEAVFHVAVPYLNAMWKLTLLFPIVMAYAMVRYDMFDVRAALRAGAVYSAATGLVVLAYTGAIAGTDILLTNWEAAQSPIVAAAVMAVLVVVLLNPLYLRSQRLVDRLFFRQRVDVQRSIEHVSEAMSGLLDLRRIVELLTQTIEEQLHPVRQELYLLDARRQGYVRADQEEADEQDGPPADRRRLAAGAVPRAAAPAADAGAGRGGSRTGGLPGGLSHGDGRSRGDPGRAVRLPGARDGLPHPGFEAVRPRLLGPGPRTPPAPGELERPRPRARAGVHGPPGDERRADAPRSGAWRSSRASGRTSPSSFPGPCRT